MKSRFAALFAVAAMTLSLAGILAVAQKEKTHDKMPAADRKEFYGWAKPVEPYRIIGNVYYVGANELTSFLIVSDAGHILIDTGMEGMASQIARNVETLGFHVADIKILLNTQAHIDHAAGLAALKSMSGAKLLISEGDAPVIESGGAKDFLWPERFRWAPAKVDGFIKDGQEIKLGGTTLTAHLTPGHTKGCTTYSMAVTEGGKEYAIVFLGSTTRVGAKLVGNKKYPEIAKDYAETFAKLRGLRCDVFLASHASFYHGPEKAAQLQKSRDPNPFVDPHEFKRFLDAQEKGFKEELAKEKGE